MLLSAVYDIRYICSTNNKQINFYFDNINALLLIISFKYWVQSSIVEQQMVENSFQKMIFLSRQSNIACFQYPVKDYLLDNS